MSTSKSSEPVNMLANLKKGTLQMLRTLIWWLTWSPMSPTWSRKSLTKPFPANVTGRGRCDYGGNNRLGATWLTLMMEEEAMNQGIQVAFRSWKRQMQMTSLQEGVQPCQNLHFSSVRPRRVIY